MRNKRVKNTTEPQYNKKLRRKRLALEILAVCVALAALTLAITYAKRVRQPPPPVPSPPDVAAEGIEIDTISEWEPAYITVYCPRTENERVNRAVRAFVDTKIEHFRQGARPDGQGKDELTVSVKVSRFDDDIVSFLFSSYTRYAGEARGRDDMDTMTFDLAAGEQYDLPALFNTPAMDEHLQALSRLAFEDLQSLAVYQASQLETSILRTGTAPTAENFARFTLDGDILRLHFPPLQVGSGANAVDQADIPLEALRPLLAQRLRAPVRGGVVDPAYTEPETEPPTLPPTLPPPDIGALQGQKLIALTFDDGPHGTQTPRLLDFLREQDVRVTFFVLGCTAEFYPDIPRRAASEGHQVASHTYNHKNLAKLGPEKLADEIERTAVLLGNLTGARPTAMRPPYGEQNAAVQAAAGTPLILWSVDPKDWSTRDADTTYSRIMNNTRDGSIILLHDFYPETIEAAKRIIPALKAQGYTFVTVDQLIAARGGAKPGDVVRNRP